jgi:hypothetical protein
MDNRLYFVLGDLLATTVVAALIGVLAVMIVGTGWNMWLAMILMMALGMMLALPGALVFGHWFGAMEVMVPVMQAGMWSGMVVGMWQAMSPLEVQHGALIGALSGLVVLNLTWVANVALRGVNYPRGGTQ